MLSDPFNCSFPDDKRYYMTMVIGSGNLNMYQNGSNENYIMCWGSPIGESAACIYTFKFWFRILDDTKHWPVEFCAQKQYQNRSGVHCGGKLCGWDEYTTEQKKIEVNNIAATNKYNASPGTFDYYMITKVTKHFRVVAAFNSRTASYLWRNETLLYEGNDSYKKYPYLVSAQAKDLCYEPLSYLIPLFVITGYMPGTYDRKDCKLVFEKSSKETDTNITKKSNKFSISYKGAKLDVGSSVENTTYSAFTKETSQPLDYTLTLDSSYLSSTANVEYPTEIPGEKQGFILFHCPEIICSQSLNKMIYTGKDYVYYKKNDGSDCNPPK